MATRGAADGAADLPSYDVWRRVRRYAVPRAMIERATDRRLAGDWRGACAAARVDVTVDPAAVARRCGARVADRFSDDLRHLAPDLLRWHLPRDADGRLAAGRRYVLDRADDWHLVAETVAAQRIRLTVSRRPGPARDTYVGHRYRWDARRADELRTRIGGSARRVPFFDPSGVPVAVPGAAHDGPGRVERAALAASTVDGWRLAGVTLRLGRLRNPDRARDVLARLPVAPARLLPEARGLLADPGPDPGGLVRFGIGHGLAVLLSTAGTARVVPAGATPGVPVLPDAAWRSLVDLDLVRHGVVGPDELHPLVRAALFPARPAAASGPPAPRPPGPVRIRCTHGERHALAVRDGRLTAPAHPPAERRRERLLHRLGGPLAPCLAALDAWESGAGRLPYELARQRFDAVERVRHGDTATLLWLLAAGLPATVRLADGGTLLHALADLDAEALLPVLLAAVPLDAVDRAGRDPVRRAELAGATGLAATLRAAAGGAGPGAGRPAEPLTGTGATPNFVALQRIRTGRRRVPRRR